MGTKTLQKQIVVDAPPAFVFERLSDHEAMAAWPGVAWAKLVREGTPRNGLGALRAVKVMGLALHEEVVHFDPPHRFDYKIVKGLPVDHLGSIRFTADGARTRIDWTVSLSSPIPLFGRAVAFALDRGLDRALAFFKQDTEARHARAA
jgi:uncharacterized membrane protein